jgi:hypothetical protein
MPNDDDGIDDGAIDCRVLARLERGSNFNDYGCAIVVRSNDFDGCCGFDLAHSPRQPRKIDKFGPVHFPTQGRVIVDGERVAREVNTDPCAREPALVSNTRWSLAGLLPSRDTPTMSSTQLDSRARVTSSCLRTMNALPSLAIKAARYVLKGRAPRIAAARSRLPSKR